MGWVRDIVIAIIIAAIILFFFKPIIIQQESMQPTFYSNDYVVVSKQWLNRRCGKDNTTAIKCHFQQLSFDKKGSS